MALVYVGRAGVVARRVRRQRGPRAADFSKWSRYNPYRQGGPADKICDDVWHNKMPLWQYRLIDPAAKLSMSRSPLLRMDEGEAAKSVGAG